MKPSKEFPNRIECKKSSSGYHLFFHMTGRCFYCGKYLAEKATLQVGERAKVRRVIKSAPGKLGVHKIGRASIYWGCWEVRGENEKESKWLPFMKHKDAEKFLAKRIKSGKIN